MDMTSSYGNEVTLTLCRECGEAELLKNVSICWCMYNIRVQWFYLFGSPRRLVVAKCSSKTHLLKKLPFFQPFRKFKKIWLQNIPCEKSYQRKGDRKIEFFTFIIEYYSKAVCLLLFWGWFFAHFSTESNSASNLHFMIPISNFWKHKFVCLYLHFLLTLKPKS